MKRTPSLVLALTLGFLFAACPTHVSPEKAQTPPAVPATGTYIGALLLDGQTTIDDFNATTGVKHAAFVQFILFPEVLDTGAAEFEKLSIFIDACILANAIPMITLETMGGLSSYTAQDVTDLAAMLYDFGVPLFLRFDHEMNGSWYPWGQQPTLYIQKFQEMATIMHLDAPNVAMAWTPNQGWGYPWAGGPYSIQPSSSDYAVLDTNHDGVVNDQDDPYSPYYPGDAAVDWVGHSFYHWSNGAARGYNQVPYAGQWGQANGIGNGVPNFHDVYAVGHDKPMMVAETSAFYDPTDKNGGGAAEAPIKNGWITEVYNLTNPDNPTLTAAFPRLKLICWFSQLKFETEVGTDVDWRLNSNAEVVQYYQQVVADPYFIQAP